MRRWGRRRYAGCESDDEELQFGPEAHVLEDPDVAKRLSDQRRLGREIFAEIGRVGDVHSVGAFAMGNLGVELPNPGIFVTQHEAGTSRPFGFLGLPMNSALVDALSALCEQAPFGDNRLKSTRVDTKAWRAAADAGLSAAVVDKLFGELNTALVRFDEAHAGAARVKVEARSQSVDMWGNTRLVASNTCPAAVETAILDLLCGLVQAGDVEAAAKLQPAACKLLTALNDAIAALEKSRFTDYSASAKRVSHPEVKRWLLSDEHELSLRLSKDARLSVHRQLEGVDVDHETTARSGTMGTMALKKRESIGAFAQQRAAELRRQRDELRSALVAMEHIQRVGTTAMGGSGALASSSIGGSASSKVGSEASTKKRKAAVDTDTPKANAKAKAKAKVAPKVPR